MYIKRGMYMTYEGLRLKIRNKFYLPITAFWRRKKLKNTNFTIISNNCWGCISLISPPNTLWPLACIVFTQAASKSCPIATFKPAFPNPMSNHIAPENKEITSLLAAYLL